MQTSASRHSSRISMALTVGLTSSDAGSDGLAVATCSGDNPDAGVGDGSGNEATTIGSSTPATVSAAAAVSGSATTVTSRLTIAGMLTAVVCGMSARSALAVSNAVGDS